MDKLRAILFFAARRGQVVHIGRLRARRAAAQVEQPNLGTANSHKSATGGSLDAARAAVSEQAGNAGLSDQLQYAECNR
jgi:hypothetical protein